MTTNRPFGMDYAEQEHAEAILTYGRLVAGTLPPVQVVGEGYGPATRQVAEDWARDRARRWAEYRNTDPNPEQPFVLTPCVLCTEYTRTEWNKVQAFPICEECQNSR